MTGQPWDDFPSFVAYVRAACARLKAPQPTLGVLELEYPRRCAELTRIRGVAKADTDAERAFVEARAEVVQARAEVEEARERPTRRLEAVR